MRVPVDVLGREADFLHQPDDARFALGLRLPCVNRQRLFDDLLHAQAGIQRRVRILKDHLDVGAIRPHLVPAERREIDGAVS